MIVSGNTFVANPDRPTLGGEKYAMMLQSAKNFNINKNTFSLEKITAIGLSQIINGSAKIANNKISINNTNTGVGNIHTSCIKFLSGAGVDIVYNNMYAADASLQGKQATALNLGSQGQTSANINVKNNIIVSEGLGFAAWLKPTGESVNSFTLSNNMYYKAQSSSTNPLFKYNTTNVEDDASWQTLTSETASYYTEDPLFAAWNDLNSTSTFLCEKGVAIAGVTDDFYGRSRPVTNPCIGACLLYTSPSPRDS